MILVDANILVYAHVRSFAQHDAARDWLDEQLHSVTAVGLPWPSLLGFLRLVTNARVFQRPEPIAAAWQQVQRWLAQEPVWIPQPTAQHDEVLGDLLIESDALGNLVPDAHLAALAREHGLTICSTDADFARFSQVRWLNPLTK